MMKKLLFVLAFTSGFFCSAQPFSCVPSITPEDWVDSDSFIRPFGLAMKYPQCAPTTDLPLVGWNSASGDLQVMPSFNTKFSAKFNGTTSQYVRGDGSFATYKAGVPYTGTTNGSGVYTVTYATAYATKPNVQAIFETTDPRDVVMLTASSTTGFTLQVQRRVDVAGVLPTYLNRSGVTVNALVTPN